MIYLEKDWYGQPCPKVGFKVSTSTQWIFKVDVRVPPEKYLLAQPYEYKEGLWEQDVAEWFIVNTRTKRYVEWNLSANGAWWMMAFSGIRQRDIDLLPDLSEVITRSSIQQNSWQAELEIPEALLVDMLGDDEWVHNVCFILGEKPRQYISLNTLISNKPDFHLPDEIITTVRWSKRP